MAERVAPEARLAVVYGPVVPAFELFEAAAGRWRLLWLVDRSVAGAETSDRLLGRLGTVVDVSGLDVDASAEALAVHEPTGIVAFGESELMRAALVGGALGLPVNTPIAVERCLNKVAQRRTLRGAGLAGPRFWAVPPDASAARRAEVVGGASYPVVVKPQVGTGSRDVFAVSDQRALRDVLDQVSGQSGPGLIIEEKIADSWTIDARPYADSVSVESVVARGTINHLAVTGRSPLAEPFQSTGSFLPANLDDAIARAVLHVAGQAITALGVSTGVLHTEVKLTPHGPWVIEVNGRVGGTIRELMYYAGGHSILELASLVALGEDLDVPSLLTFDRVGFAAIGVPPVGATRLIDYGGLNDVRRVPGVEEISINTRPGQAVDWKTGGPGHLYRVFGTVDDYETLWKTRDLVHQTMQARFAFAASPPDAEGTAT